MKMIELRRWCRFRGPNRCRRESSWLDDASLLVVWKVSAGVTCARSRTCPWKGDDRKAGPLLRTETPAEGKETASIYPSLKRMLACRVDLHRPRLPDLADRPESGLVLRRRILTLNVELRSRLDRSG